MCYTSHFMSVAPNTSFSLINFFPIVAFPTVVVGIQTNKATHLRGISLFLWHQCVGCAKSRHLLVTRTICVGPEKARCNLSYGELCTKQQQSIFSCTDAVDPLRSFSLPERALVGVSAGGQLFITQWGKTFCLSRQELWGWWQSASQTRVSEPNCGGIK